MFSDRRKRDMATNHGGYLNNNNKPSYGRGGGGGSMVVLSRPRSSQNAGQKLSVPPPLNLPSLRKEHERVDSSGSSFLSGGGVSGSGARPASSGMGWSKPASDRVEEPLIRAVEKVSTLRGEDFPSLKASLPSASSVSETQKHKDGLNQNQNQKQNQKREEFPKENRAVRPQNRFLGNEELSERPSFSDGVKKKDYLLPGPLPIVRMSPRSDWADDERDTSHGFRDRDYGYSKSEPVVVREANAWRASSPLQNEVANNNNNNNNRGIYGARPNSRGREGLKKSNYVLSGPRDNVWNSSGAREAHGGGRQPWSNNNGVDHQNRDKRPLFKNDKPHVEDHFGDSGFDVHDPFPVLGVAKKKKEALKHSEFHDPVRESFEAELERVQKMQEEERRRIIEEQERVIELVRTEEEERLRLAREQDEQQSRLEEEAREAAVRNEQERLEAARRAEELRKSKEEEKHKLILEEERRKQAAKQKLLELEEKISRRQAEAAKGCSNSSEDVVKEKESSDVDWEDSERMVDRITTSSASRDGSFGFQDRHKPFWRKEDVESGGNSRFIENVPQRDVGEGFPKEFFGTAGYIGNANSYFKPGFPEHSVDQSWRTPGDGRSYGRNYGMEQPEPEQQQYGNNPGWGQSQSRGRRGGAYPSYPEKLYPNHEEDDYYPFGRPKYSVRQPRVLPPPPQESRQKLPFRSEAEHHPGPSTSVLASYIGDLQDHHHVMSGTGMDDHRFDSKLTGRCDSQSSLSITSTPDSLVHISHDDLDESGNSSVLVSSRKGDGDAGKDSLMNATCPVSCWDNEEWALDNNERLQEQEEYDEDEDGYQEEDKVQGVDENIDLTQELEELHLQEKDSNLVLGFNEGVEVEIPSDDLEKCQQKDSFLDGERPCSCDEQAAKPAEVSDNASTSFQGTETNSASYPTVSTHLVAPPYSIGLHQSHVPSASAQMEDRVQFQFGLFSGPSLIPSPFPAIQIGSIQMPLPLDPQFGSSLTHIQQPQSPFIQFGQLGYTSLITQGVLPPPQNPGSMATGQLGQGRNAAAPASNPQISVLRRPVDVSDGNKLKNANISPASGEVAVPPPHKQGEFSGKSEPASRKMSHGRSNFADRQTGGGQVVSRNSGGTGEASRGDAGGYRRYQRQRVEFRVRESNWPSEENRNGNGKSQNSNKSGSRKYVVSKSQKYSSDSSVSGSNSVQKVEGPSDDNDDDFIEVRSKRQMHNDRREQREKEIKEKSQASKASRKPRSTVQNSTAAARSNRSPPGGRVVNTKQINPVSNRQLLAPIGTPSPKTDSHGDEKTGSSRDIPDQNPGSSFAFSNKNNVLESVQTSVGTWSNQLTDQPVMALTQSQLDEAMKPASLLSCVSVENGVNRISEPNPKSTSSVAPPKNNTFPSPVNSLLAEGKIQFGAVTSSSVIPPCGENNSSLYFEKDRTPSSSSGMEICEAEAAASAIAVAAITSDETSGNAGSVLPAETKIYGGTSGTVVAQPSLSKAEESLTVSLPADLSVETPISLWPPVPSPHNSNQMITHFPQAPPHFPFYDMNPMLRGPIYAFGPHHDSGANQPQSQKGPSGPPTTWQQQQGHSGVDSFYAPAGFTGPFLTPPGAMPPGVQGPPHMFVYNHFAPVGQFGGLSFMGTTYIPSGKQPDWKHNPMVSSSQAGGDGDVNNPTVSPMQCNVVPASLQHLAMPSPLAMFEPSPFQSSSSQEMPVRARWPYMPFPGPPAMQIQNQQEAVDGSPSQFNNNNNMLPPPSNRYPNIQTPTVADAADSSNSYGSTASQPKPITTLSDPNTQNPANPAFKPPPQPQQQQQSSQEKNTQSQHVGGSSHHNQHQHQHNRRSGFHGRNQAVTRERGYHNNNTKVKQIYVAKQTSSNSNNASASASSTTTASPSI